MTTFAVLATGPSMSQSIADYVRGKCRAVAVSDAYRLAPWADCLVSNDRAWWSAHPDAMKFAGRKFSAARISGVSTLPRNDMRFQSGSNSGLQGMRVAHYIMGATRILLLGFDMHGSHFFGAHPAPLRNTTTERFRVHIKQCCAWRGCEVVNCTPGSALKRFPFADIHDVLGETVVTAETA